MDEKFQLSAPEEVQLWLKSFAEPERRKGHSLFTNGFVLNLRSRLNGSSFRAEVQDGSEVLDTRMNLNGDWTGECNCGYPGCAHQFALGSAVLAEHRTSLVRELSGSLARSLEGSKPQPRSHPVFSSEPLEKQLLAALGRPLTGKEAAFLRKLHNVYEHSRRTSSFSPWLLQDLRPWFRHFFVGQLWPSFPQTELEFWLYLAYAQRQNQGEIPEFMAPITKLEPIEERMRAWHRSQEVRNWKSTLGSLQHYNPPPKQEETREVDLRIALGPNDLRIQWRTTDAPDFTDAKDLDFHRLAQELKEGKARLTGEGELIWDSFTRPSPLARVCYRYMDPERAEALRRVFRTKMLESRIVSATGQPLERIPEPLQWKVVAPESEEGDYRIVLVQADGSPPPPTLLVLEGRPAFYVTAQAVFCGPERPGFLHKENHTAIPAEAVESPVGVNFLRSLGVELPPRLRERVCVLPVEVLITCELRSSDLEIGPEECVFHVSAEASDGHQEAWTGYDWRPAGRKAKKKGAEISGRKITIYDRTNLTDTAALLQPLNLKNDYRGHWTIRVTKKFPELFSEWLKAVPPHVHVELKGELASFMSADVSGSLKLDVNEVEIDWFDLRVVLDVADTTLTPEEIKLLLNAKGRYVRLEGKGWRRLKFNLDDDENERLARLGLSARELSAEPQRLHALQLSDPAARKFLPAAQVEQLQRRAEELKTRVAPELPEGVTAELRPYQLEGYQFLAYLSTNRFGGILADDMGLGKTLQTLAWLMWLRQQATTGSPVDVQQKDPVEQCSTSLVVCPKSVMDNWHAEAAKFTPELRVRCWSAGELGNLPLEIKSADVHVLNYNQLRSLGEELQQTRWLAVILDEGQYIKNPNSQTAQVARSLRAGHRLVLTGTPIENRLLDLWSLMSFTMPGVLGNRAQFGRIYDSKGDPFARRRLAARVRPFVLRRTKAQVAKDLPDRIEEDLFCEIEGEQNTLYRAELKRAQQLLLGIRTPRELAEQQFNFLTSLLRLRQICCHPRLIKPDAAGSAAKTDALLEQLEPLMEEGEKVLVFSQFVQMLDLLRPALEEREWPVFYLAGQTENRGALVKQFQEAPGPGVFLISLKAGGFGLNLTAANYVVLFDPWWNPAVENQAIDRTHRIGQTNKVIAYRLLIKNSIEEKIRELQKQKKALAEDVLGEEKFSQSLTLDDLRFLFAE